MAYYMNKNVPAKRGDIFYISNSKCYATDPSNTEGRPAIVVSSDKLNEHADVVEVVYLTTKEKRLMPTHAEVLCKIPSTALCETIYTVNKDRLGDFVRTCTDKEMEGVNAGIVPMRTDTLSDSMKSVAAYQTLLIWRLLCWEVISNARAFRDTQRSCHYGRGLILKDVSD